jgi:hypothetical protein
MIFSQEGVYVFVNLFFMGEALSYLSGYINSQNDRIQCAENAHALQENPLHLSKMGVWCTVCRKRIVGPAFFKETITAENYLCLLIALLPQINGIADFRNMGHLPIL